MSTSTGIDFDIQLQTDVSRSIRVRQLESLFEVPAKEKLTVALKGNLPLDERPWNVGLIVGPSGSGKTSILERLWGKKPLTFEWNSPAVIDDFSSSLSIGEIVAGLKSVGFNTIPAWMRPFKVLSNGERFRCELARRLLEDSSPVLIDEFTSVVDRQIARIGAAAVAKYVSGKSTLQVICATCHYDVVDWLDPDWIYDPALQSFNWRLLRGRPPIKCEVAPVKYEAWKFFAPYHYMSAELNKTAQCFGLYVGNTLTSFCGVLHMPHPRVRDIMSASRLVTLPDWQGLGLAFVLSNTLGEAYSGIGKRLRFYPNHPAYIHSFERSPLWVNLKRHGDFSPRRGNSATIDGYGGKSCAVYEYRGKAMQSEEARRLLNV
jgi:hypothetical protein